MSNVIDSIKVSGTVYTLSAQTGGGGSPTVELTQAQYDALVTAGTVAQDTYYIITDASPAEMSQYWTSAQTNSAITQATSGKLDTSTFETYSGSVETALSGKQDTLSAGTGIDITDNVISATGGGGGGKAVTGGTNISVTTGTTADTINCTLPISGSSEGLYTTSSNPFTGSATKTKNVVFGDNNSISAYGSSSNLKYDAIFGYNNRITARGQSNFVTGENNKVQGSSGAWYAAIFGVGNKTNNYTSEFAAGRYNQSNSVGGSSFGDSGNTLFSVGNGTADNARHNAFEIRQNGDIYYFDGTNDVKLQDKFSSLETTIGDINTILQSI